MNSYLVYRVETGRIVNITVGEPPCSEGFACIEASGDIALAAMGDRLLFAEGGEVSVELGEGIDTIDEALVAPTETAQEA